MIDHDLPVVLVAPPRGHRWVSVLDMPDPDGLAAAWLTQPAGLGPTWRGDSVRTGDLWRVVGGPWTDERRRLVVRLAPSVEYETWRHTPTDRRTLWPRHCRIWPARWVYVAVDAA